MCVCIILVLSCNKDQLPADLSQSEITVSEGRLAFESNGHFEQFYRKLVAEPQKKITSKGFKSIGAVYDEIDLFSMSDDEFINFVSTDQYRKYYETEVDELGLKSAEPLIVSPTLKRVLNTEFEMQVGDDVIKYHNARVYTIPIDKYSLASFKENATDIYSLEKNSKARTFQGTGEAANCTTFFLKKRGNWQRKVQGKILQQEVFPNNMVEVIALTKSRKRNGLWWSGTRDYNLEMAGEVVLGNGTHQVSDACNSCADLHQSFDAPLGFGLEEVDVFHIIECNDDCRDEGDNGFANCRNDRVF